MVYFLFKAFVFNLCIMDYFLCFLPWFSFFFFSPNFLTFFMGTTNRFQEPRFRALGRGGGGGGGGAKRLVWVEVML